MGRQFKIDRLKWRLLGVHDDAVEFVTHEIYRYAWPCDMDISATFEPSRHGLALCEHVATVVTHIKEIYCVVGRALNLNPQIVPVG